ncbi:hypothetical protein F2Q70_00031936, partial [Brassica cretica]
DIGGSGSVKTSKERRDNENPKVKHELRVNCAEALWMLARGNVANSRRITETKGLVSLAKIVEKEIGELQYNCLMTLMEITASAESQTLTLDEQLSRRIHLLLNAGTAQALIGAWKAACKVVGGKVEIPAGKEFMVKAVTLQGPCKEETVVQIEGTLVAPTKIGSWPKSSLFQWLNFKWVSHVTIQGSGTLDARGYNWWNLDNYQTQKRNKYIPPMKPTALRFYSSGNVTVRDISIVNSPLCHLKFDDSDGVKINNITISSPENSPNTDGIHLQNTRNVEIQHSNIACGRSRLFRVGSGEERGGLVVETATEPPWISDNPPVLSLSLSLSLSSIDRVWWMVMKQGRRFETASFREKHLQ